MGTPEMRIGLRNTSYLPSTRCFPVQVLLGILLALSAVFTGCSSGPTDEKEPVLTQAERNLWQAVYDSDLKAVKRAIQAGANVECRDRDRRTPLIEAVIRNNPGIAEVLLDSGANVNAAEFSQCRGLHFAVFRRNPHMVALLLGRGAETDPRDEDQCTPLIRAVLSFNARAKPDDEGNEALYAIAELLLRSGADASVEGPDGVSLLAYARNSGKLRMTHLLKQYTTTKS